MVSNLVPTLKFLVATTKHKYFVFKVGLRTKAPIWRLIIHDWTKYFPSEAPHYGRKHFGANDDQLAYVLAWNHHQKAHPHHWEYWIPLSTHGKSPVAAGEPLPMPEWAVREMVADILAASLSYEGFMPPSYEDFVWYHTNKSKIKLHESSRILMENVLKEVLSD